MEDYKSKCLPSEISATSRTSVKVKDNFYTIEVSETRLVTTTEDINMSEEYKILFDELNEIVDDQVTDIIRTFKHDK